MNEAEPGPYEHGPTVVVDAEGAPGGDPMAVADVSGLVRLLSRALAAEGIGSNAEAGLHIVDGAAMAELNEKHMGVAGPTDVLSFPVDGTEITDAGALPRLVGDVVLCSSVARANAPGHAGTFLDECRLLVVHGALHLCGWDHATPDEQRAMWAREREIMESLGLEPAGDPWRCRQP